MSGAATVAEWAAAAARFADEWPTRGARAAGARIEDYVAADTGGDGRLSRLKGGSADVTIEGGSGEAQVAAGGDAGLWSILENGTRAHVTHARPGGFLLTPYGPRRMVQVSGVAARQTWSKGSVAGMVEAERDADLAFGEVMG